jgi:hypothetical protein
MSTEPNIVQFDYQYVALYVYPKSALTLPSCLGLCQLDLREDDEAEGKDDVAEGRKSEDLHRILTWTLVCGLTRGSGCLDFLGAH